VGSKQSTEIEQREVLVTQGGGPCASSLLLKGLGFTDACAPARKQSSLGKTFVTSLIIKQKTFGMSEHQIPRVEEDERE
jgi:hypothetical protein